MQYISLKGVKKSSNESSNSLETRIIKEANTKLKNELTNLNSRKYEIDIFYIFKMISETFEKNNTKNDDINLKIIKKTCLLINNLANINFHKNKSNKTSCKSIKDSLEKNVKNVKNSTTEVSLRLFNDDL